MQELEACVDPVGSADQGHVQSALYHHSWKNIRHLHGMESLVLAIVQRVGLSALGNRRHDLGEKRR